MTAHPRRVLLAPGYRVERVEGEPHAQTFHVTCEVPALQLAAVGRGSSRRRAEQEAAERILSGIEGGTEPQGD